MGGMREEEKGERQQKQTLFENAIVEPSFL